MTALAGWLLLPLLLYVLSLGLGLLAERVAGMRVKDGLVAPLGFCVLVLLGMPVYRLHGPGWVAAALCAIGAVAGLVLARRELRERVNAGWPLVAGGAAYLLFLAPAAFTGDYTWAGYNFVNDTAVFFVLVDQLQAVGTTQPELGNNVVDNVLSTYLSSEYPMGTMGALATLGELLPVGVEVYFQPFVAALAAFGAMALTTLGRHLVAGGWAALAAVGALSANLVFQFAQQGAVKEIGVVCTLCIAVALGRELLGSEKPKREVVGLALALGAAMTVFSTAAGAWVVLVALAVFVAALVRKGTPLRKHLWASAAIGALVLIVVLAPTLPGLVRFGEVAAGVNTAEAGAGGTAFGQLARPLLLEQTLGTWLGLYIFPINEDVGTTVTTVIICFSLIALVLGLVVILRRREPGPLLLLVPLGLGALILGPRVSPYADAKLLMVLSVPVVFCAVLGCMAAAPAWKRLRIPGAALAGVVLVGVFASAAVAYHDVRLAPVEKIELLRDAGERLVEIPGRVGVFEPEEFAKAVMRAPRLEQGTESLSPRFLERRGGGFVETLGGADLDELSPAYVQSFDGLLLRRGPAMSRPPANYRLVYENADYEVWRKQPGLRVLEHLPLYGRDVRSRPAAQQCDAILRLARQARAPGRELIAAVAPEVVLMDTVDAPFREVGWPPNQDQRQPATVTLATPGAAGGPVFADGGRYRVWVRGTFGREMTVKVDDRRVGRAQGIDTPLSYHRAGSVELTPGRHEVVLERGGGGLGPGDGARSWAGPVALEREGETRLQRVDPARARELCSQTLDWVELVERT